MQNSFSHQESTPVIQFFSYAIPAIIGMLLTSAIVIIDGLFVGNIIGEKGLAGLNLTLPVFYLFLGLSIMIGVGGAVNAGHALGAKNHTRANTEFSSTIVLAIIIIIPLVLLCFLFFDSLLALLSTHQELSEFVRSYLGTILFFYPVIMLNIIFSIFIRTQGKPGLALIFDLTGNGLNVILDYLMIAHWDMGLSGAALASGISVILPMCCAIQFFLSRRSLLRFVTFPWNWRNMAQVMFNGSSEMMGQISVGVTTWIFNRVILSRIGIDGVAAYTIVGYVAFVQVMIMTGYATGLGPIVGYSFGAGKTDHIKRIMAIALISGFITGILCWAIAHFFSTSLSEAFTPGNETIATIVSSGFRLFATAFILNGFNILITTYFTAIGNALTSVIIAALRGLILINLFILILPHYSGDAGIWLSYPLSELVTLGVSIWFLQKSRWSDSHSKCVRPILDQR